MASRVLRVLFNPKVAEGVRTGAAIAVWVLIVFAIAAAWEMRADLAGVYTLLGLMYDAWAAEPAKRGDVMNAVVSTLLLILIHRSLLPKSPR